MSKPIKLDDKVDKDQELGTLIVVLLKARNLHDKHSFRKQDAFAQATLNGITKKTQVEIKAGQHPVWDGEVRFSVMKSTAAKHRKMEVACFAKEPRSDDLLGRATVDIGEILRKGEFDDWVPLDIDGVQRGDVYLEMTYYANAPAPANYSPNHSPKPSTPAPAPANNKLLASVLGSDLQRRPSKLSPSDRLSRPGQHSQGGTPSSLAPGGPGPSKLAQSSHGSYSPPRQQQQQRPNPNGGGGLPGSLTPSYPGAGGGYSPPKGRNDPLPPTPIEQGGGGLPSLLRPGGAGGGRTPPSSTPIPLPHQQGGGGGYGRYPSSSPTSQPGSYLHAQYGGSPPRGPSPAPGQPQPPNPYIGGGGSASGPSSGTSTPNYQLQANPYITGPSHPQTPQPTGPPPIWRPDGTNANGGRPTSPVIDPGVQGAGGFAFPLPSITSPIRESYGDNGGYPPMGGRGGGGYGYPQQQQRREEWDVDPSRIARYQTPLALPPGAPAPASTSASTYTPPAPAPAPTYAPAPAPAQSWSPPKASTPLPDQHRLDALRRAEDDARRRHEQEMKDLELAMQLDRELNLAEDQARNSNSTAENGMPGGWSRSR